MKVSALFLNESKSETHSLTSAFTLVITVTSQYCPFGLYTLFRLLIIANFTYQLPNHVNTFTKCTHFVSQKISHDCIFCCYKVN